MNRTEILNAMEAGFVARSRPHYQKGGVYCAGTRECLEAALSAIEARGMVVVPRVATEEWLPIESAPEEWRDGRRLLLGWMYDNTGLTWHYELGWFDKSAWRNTYGHPFSGQPDFVLLPRPLPSPPQTKDTGHD